MQRLIIGLVIASCVFLLTACPSSPPLAGKGTLQIVISGLPDGVGAAMTVSSSGFSQSITASATLSDLTPGRYTVAAASVELGDDTYTPDRVAQDVMVEAGRTADVSVVYTKQTPATGSLELAVVGLPEGMPAEVTVTGPGNFSQTVNASALLKDLEPGVYTLSAAEVTATYTYAPDPASRTVSVTAHAMVKAGVTYTAVTGALAVDIEGLPGGVSAGIILSGPGGFSQEVAASGVIKNLDPGSYDYDAPDVVAAASVTAGTVGYTYEVLRRSVWSGTVTAGETVTLKLTYEPVTGSLLVVVRGLVSGVDADVTVTGDGFSQAFTLTGALNNLEAGSYVVAASPVEAGGYIYKAGVAPSAPTVAAGKTTVVEVAYAAIDGKLTLRAEGLPTGGAASVEVTGPSIIGSVSYTMPITLSVIPGDYGFDPQAPVAVGADSYHMVDGPRFAKVVAGKETTATFHYAVVGSLQIIISGLPNGTDAKVFVNGPNGYQSGLITITQTLNELPIGAYTVEAQHLVPLYYADPTSQTATVKPNQTVTVTVRYRPPVVGP